MNGIILVIPAEEVSAIVKEIDAKLEWQNGQRCSPTGIERWLKEVIEEIVNNPAYYALGDYRIIPGWRQIHHEREALCEGGCLLD